MTGHDHARSCELARHVRALARPRDREGWALWEQDVAELERMADGAERLREQIRASLKPHRAASGEWADADVKLAEIQAALEASA